MRRHPQRGFALVVVLSIMVLLATLALGLLSMSSITLRASERGTAAAIARSNARMALILALGELQKNAGPDQRVTARADILDEKISNPRLTGVWKSWEIKAAQPPAPAEYDRNERDKKFLGWLTSSADGIAQNQVAFASAAPQTPATLWGKGTLGQNADPRDLVTATKVEVTSQHGAFAWAVMDEGVKARVNTPYVDNATAKGSQIAQLGSGVRPNTASISAMSAIDRSNFQYGTSQFATMEKGITRSNFGYAADTVSKGAGAALKPLAHDITTQSVGMFTDTAAGGLKEDFNLLANATTLPANYAGKGVYASRLGLTAVSDPRWESLQQLAGLYKDSSRFSDSGGVPLVKASTPQGWLASTGSDPATGDVGTTQRAAPAGLVLMPSIAKVQVVFSLLTRDIYNYPKISDTRPKQPGTKDEETAAQLHGPWGKNLAGSSYDYLLHLLYTPVVTLHNPYNVALEFSELKVMFGNVPFALQVFRNGVAQTTAPAPLDTMYYSAGETGSRPKRFGMTLKTNGGSSTSPSAGSSTFRLLPGEVMMFSPYIDPNRTWKDEYTSRTFSDWDSGSGSNRTLTIDGLPGWRGDGIGFDLDWFCPSYKSYRITSNETENGTNMDRGGCIAAKSTDEFSLKFAPLSVDTLSQNKFTITLFAKPVGASSQVAASVIEMDYEKPTGLQDYLLGAGGTITYPKQGTINTMAMHSHSVTPIKDISNAKPFAIISAQAKTTMGGFNPDGEDGKLAAKPWAFGHEVVAASSGKVVSEHPANLSHEISLQRLDAGTNNLLQFDPATGRGNAITGQTGNTGIKFGALYDIPVAPLQNLAQLNAANPGGSSGYLPRFAQPIGNSWAHPMLDPSRIVTKDGNGDRLDHSFLLNLALYDHFYFSGLADQTGPYGSNTAAPRLAEQFANGKPLSDPRLELRAPDGRPRTEFTKDAQLADAYAKIAGWQVINGPFNINSTSVTAWKAMLGSIHDGKALYNSLNKTAKTSALTSLPPVDSAKGQSRISRFRLPASLSEEDGGDPMESYWLGAREYSDAQLDALAREIVKQVRARGPFLSMAEFVNRRLGANETAQRGALQQAIDNTKINDALATTSSAGYDIAETKLAGYKYANPPAGAGSSYQGAPGYLSQADVLNVLGNAATPRSDTFTIRGYGEARDATGKTTATAVCETVVQRVPDYLDPTDRADTVPASLKSPVNKTFGRAFAMVSFRWLIASEI